MSVVVAVMEEIEERAFSKFPTLPAFWKKYVDDIVTAFLPKDSVQQYLEHLNSLEKCIKFTVEIENQK